MTRLHSRPFGGESKEREVNKPEAPLAHRVNTSTSWLSRRQVAEIREAGHSFPRMTHLLASLLEVATTCYGTRPYRANPLQHHDISSTLLSASQSGPLCIRSNQHPGLSGAPFELPRSLTHPGSPILPAVPKSSCRRGQILPFLVDRSHDDCSRVSVKGAASLIK